MRPALMRFTLLMICAVCAGTDGAAEWTPLYALVDLGTLGGNHSWPQDINDAGDVVGSSTLAVGSGRRAFLHTNGVMRDLGTLGGDSSYAYGINNAGQVVGWSDVPSNITRAFLYSEGVMTDLGTLGGSHSGALAINDRGQITGYSQTASGQYLAFLHSGGVTEPLSTMAGDNSYGWRLTKWGDVVGRLHHIALGYSDAFLYLNGMIELGEGHAYDVNDDGHVVGFGPYGGWTYFNGRMKNLSQFGVQMALGINNRREIVGVGPNRKGVWQGLVYRDGAVIYLNEVLDTTGEGWRIVQAVRINERGQIAAIGEYGGFQRTVRLDPLPAQ